MAFSNRDRLRRRLKAIPIAVRKAAKAQLRANAVELVETIKNFAPIQEGALVSSVKQQDVSDSTRISRRVSAGSREARYASWVEFGTSKTEARSFFWPAFRLKRRRFNSRMNRAAKKAIADAIK